MLVFGTQLHLVTFVLVCIEILLLVCLIISKLVKPEHRKTGLNIILVSVLIIYNLTGGLLPDQNLPGSLFLQNCVAYGTGFIGPSFFPYYVYSAFGLSKMKFHAYYGVTYFLFMPYGLFVLLYAISEEIRVAQYILVIPIFYATWVIWSLANAIRQTCKDGPIGDGRIETAILILSLSPWVFLPVIDFFKAGQVVEVSTMNAGFLLLLFYQVKQNISGLRREHAELSFIERNLLQPQLQPSSKSESFIQHCNRYQLTKRETEIALFICNGYTYKRIAETLFISERTVSKHIQHIFEKVQVNNKIELVNKIAS